MIQIGLVNTKQKKLYHEVQGIEQLERYFMKVQLSCVHR